MDSYLKFSDPVSDATTNGAPIVALESTVIAHGLPIDAALATAASMSQVISAEGAVPAMIGLLDGSIKIGLNDAEIERLATTDNVLKVSRRDFAYALATRQDGATTVAGTMMAASLANIPIMATGGIGGVHRGAENTMDISADLQELGTTNVAVVCTGAKAILDLPKTLEYLETMGVAVIGVGTNEFPAFFVGSSGLPVAHRLDAPKDIAKFLYTHNRLQILGGVLIANLPPADFALPEDDAETVISKAIQKAQSAAIHGHAVTPYLLDEIATDTDGRSIDANRALLIANARLAAKIARALSTMTNTQA
ncbi:pseudouridine-5'-phosphate glycosidase [Alphaproteobacteria bacterium]|nr:pseudouridine-5'-phosphate glycosidase [Alphaproteobacteria bacterium]